MDDCGIFPESYLVLQSRMAVQFPPAQIVRLPMVTHPGLHFVRASHALAAAMSGNPVCVMEGQALVFISITTVSCSAAFVCFAMTIVYMRHSRPHRECLAPLISAAGGTSSCGSNEALCFIMRRHQFFYFCPYSKKADSN